MTRRFTVIILMAAIGLAIAVAAPTFRNDADASVTSWIPLLIGIAVLATAVVLGLVWGRTSRGSDRR